VPGQFPPGFASLSGDVETISRFLNAPTYISRTLRTLAEQQFVGDVLLTGRVPTSGGGVLYEVSESIFSNRSTLEPINPGSEFPLATTSPGGAQLSTVKKWGLDTKITLEAIQRLRWDPVQRGLLKLTNSLVNYWDGSVVMPAINAAVTQTQAAAATWGGASSNVLLDLASAKATIFGLKQGYVPDTLLMTHTKYAVLLADKNVATAMAREDKTNPIYSGQLGRLVGLDIMVSPNAPTNPLVLDRSMLGSIADERGFQTGSNWDFDTESWRLRVLRSSVPIIQEPGAGVFITGS
jgi:hypothetical protein